jgi:GGDEF domain-containing protein
VVGMWHSGEGEETSVERVLQRVTEVLQKNPARLPNGEEKRLTFSAGACRWKPGDDADGLFSRADESLYRAKADGSTTVMAHTD